MPLSRVELEFSSFNSRLFVAKYSQVLLVVINRWELVWERRQLLNSIISSVLWATRKYCRYTQLSLRKGISKVSIREEIFKILKQRPWRLNKNYLGGKVELFWQRYTVRKAYVSMQKRQSTGDMIDMVCMVSIFQTHTEDKVPFWTCYVH